MSTVAVPAPPVVGADSITYTLPAGTAVRVSATGPCWVQVRSSGIGPVVREATLAAGQTITAATPLWIRFGDPSNAAAAVNGTPLRLPVLSGQLIVVSPGTTP